MLLTWRDLTARRASRHRPNLSTRQLFVLTTLSCAHRRRVAQPNGSRLRCGRNGGGRKEAELLTARAGEATQSFLTLPAPVARHSLGPAHPSLANRSREH